MPGTETRTIPQRLEEAMPLLVAAAGCAALAVALRLSNNAAALGRMELWGLFVALTIVAGAGAIVSMLVRDSDVGAESPVTEPETGPRDSAEGSNSRSAFPMPAAPVGPSASPVELQDSSRTPLPDTLWAESASDMEFDAVGEPEAAPVARTSRRPSAPVTEPAEAIAEIDDLWTDLERLRRNGRRHAPA